MKFDSFIKDEEGFTTLGMAVALLVALSLIFSSAQIYRFNSMAGEIQEVADAAALAAENQVAEYMIAARVADGVALSMTLLGYAAYGLGTVALCVPPTAEMGVKLLDTGKKTLKARDSFVEKAVTALNALQRALPFLAAAHAAGVAAANGEQRSGGYLALVLLLPEKGDELTTSSSSAEEALQEQVDEEADALAEAAQRAEEALEAAEEARLRAYQRDCGDNPNYCLYERAGHLAALSGSKNPYYASVDTWSFSVPLERARAYYVARLLSEQPANDSVKEQARSALRKQFYAYAIKQLREAYVNETDGSFQAYFPRFPRNTEQMRETVLYTDPVYPVTQEDGVLVMHAWEGCPESGLVDYYSSAEQWDAGGFTTCSACEFTSSALGSIAAASTSISNGFEYHYDAIAQAAEDYQKAREEAEPAFTEAQEKAKSILDTLADLWSEATANRIQVSPPGKYGCIALVVAPGSENAGRLSSSFVQGGTLGPRVAVSGATLISDTTEGSSVISGLLSAYRSTASLGGVGSLLLDCWSGALESYATGVKGFVSGVESAINALPLLSLTGLGTWAANRLKDGIEAAGLEPAATASLKPVTVNTASVALAEQGDYASRYLSVRNMALSSSGSSDDTLGLLSKALERTAYDQLSSLEFEIARIEIPEVGISYPLTITLPQSVATGAAGLVEKATETLRSVASELGAPSTGKVWM